MHRDNVTDNATFIYETIHGEDVDPDEVTPQPRHLYTSDSDARLYYVASDGSTWTIDEDTGAVAPATLPEFICDADIDPAWAEDWATAHNQLSEWARLDEVIRQGKETIESEGVGFAAVLGDGDGWGACLGAAGTISEVVAHVTNYASSHDESPSETLRTCTVRDVTRRYLAAWRSDPETCFAVNGEGCVDLTAEALDEWGQW